MKKIASNRLSLSTILFCLWIGLNSPQGFSAQSVETTPAPVYVILWFDTEDYLLPADDEACKRLAQMLTERRVRATFKVVGEKARVLEQRGRRDVIAALRKHDIAYHANFHSVHPTPTEYLADCGLLDGMEEFRLREGGGAADVRRIFGVRTLGCYGQPGSSWAPQAIGALRSIGVAPHGIACYVDEGDHVGLEGKPFWYMGALNVYHMGQNYTRMELHDPAAVEPAFRKVDAIAERLRREGGGLISIFYHPCEWVHREFWDGVNFRRGANPPREQWRPPPQRSQRETDEAFARFAAYLEHIQDISGLRFITASDLPELYPDRIAVAGASEGELSELISRMNLTGSSELNFQRIGRSSFSVADQFELLAKAIGPLLKGQALDRSIKATGILGPDSPAPDSPRTRLEWTEFRDTALQVCNLLQQERRVPARVFVGAEPIAPEAFLGVMAEVYAFHTREHRLPEGMSFDLRKRTVGSTRYIAEDTPDLFGGWIIHKEGFRAPKLMELARLQAWTLKPAIREDSIPKRSQ